MTRSSSALWSLLRADGASGSSHRRVQCHGGANERLQRLFINLVALMEIDCTPGVAFEAGVEEACRVLQRRALGEGHLHDILVRLAGADYSGVRPHRNPSPLPLLDHFGVGLLDENSDPSERLAPPITQLLDSRIYQLRGRVSFLRAAPPLLHGCCRSFGNDGERFGRGFAHWSILLSRSSRWSNRLCQKPAIWLVQSISGAKAPSCAL